MKTRARSSLAWRLLGILTVSLLAVPTAGNAWTCTTVSNTPDTNTTLTKADPVEQLAAGIISGYLCQDLELIAEQEGISLEESIERYAWQDAFSYLVNEIREKYPEAFTGSWIRNDVNGFVSFTGTAPAEAVEAIRAFPHPIRIIENRGFTEAALNKRHGIVSGIVSSYEEVIDYISTYSITTGQIQVTIVLHDSIDTPAKKATILNRIRAEIPAGRDGTIDDIDLNVTDLIEGGPEPDAIDLITVDPFDINGGPEPGMPNGESDAGRGVDPLVLLLLVCLAAASLLLVLFLLRNPGSRRPRTNNRQTGGGR